MFPACIVMNQAGIVVLLITLIRKWKITEGSSFFKISQPISDLNLEVWTLSASCSRICALTPRTALGSFQETHPPPPSSVLPLSCYCLSCPASSSSWAVSSHLLAATGERSHCFSAKPVLHLHLTITLPAFLDTQFLIDTHIGFSMYQNDFKSIKILSDI